MKKNKQLILGYVLASLILWVCFGGYFGYRFIKYYKLEEENALPSSEVVSTTNLNELIHNDLVSDDKDGLHSKDDGTTYYYGDVKNNYLYYSGITWRIMGTDDTGYIKLISEDNLYATIYDSSDSDYKTSRVYTYLSKIESLLDEPTTYLFYGDFSYGAISSSDVTDETTSSIDEFKYVGLPTVAEYNEAGGFNSYLNTGSAFWTSNSDASDSNKVYYVTSNGAVSTADLSSTDKGIYSVRAVIVLKSNFNVLSGNGTSSAPYIINQNEYTNLKDVNLGNYVSYSDKVWRVIDVDSNGVKLLACDVIKNSSVSSISSKQNDKGIFMSEYSSYDYSPSTTLGQLINAYKDDLDRDYLEYTTFYNGAYNSNNSYKVKTSNTYSNSIGAPSPEDFLVTSTTPSKVAYWTSTYNNSTAEFINIVTTGGGIGSDYSENECAFRPVVNVSIKCKIASGSGTYADPYTITLGE